MVTVDSGKRFEYNIIIIVPAYRCSYRNSGKIFFDLFT